MCVSIIGHNALQYQSLTGKLPDMNLIHKFGTTCFIYVQKAKKLDEKAQKGIFLGYDKSSPSFLVYLPGQNVTKTRNVKFFNDMSHDDKNYNNNHQKTLNITKTILNFVKK